MNQSPLTWLAVPLLLPCLPVNGADAAKPNLVFIIADDCTFRDIGCYGGQAHTPNIDKLAGQGIRMTRCFQAAPMCSPTRHNIHTVLFPVRGGAYPNHPFVKHDVKSVDGRPWLLCHGVPKSGMERPTLAIDPIQFDNEGMLIRATPSHFSQKIILP